MSYESDSFLDKLKTSFSKVFKRKRSKISSFKTPQELAQGRYGYIQDPSIPTQTAAPATKSIYPETPLTQSTQDQSRVTSVSAQSSPPLVNSIQRLQHLEDSRNVSPTDLPTSRVDRPHSEAVSALEQEEVSERIKRSDGIDEEDESKTERPISDIASVEQSTPAQTSVAQHKPQDSPLNSSPVTTKAETQLAESESTPSAPSAVQLEQRPEKTESSPEVTDTPITTQQLEQHEVKQSVSEVQDLEPEHEETTTSQLTTQEETVPRVITMKEHGQIHTAESEPLHRAPAEEVNALDTDVVVTPLETSRAVEAMHATPDVLETQEPTIQSATIVQHDTLAQEPESESTIAQGTHQSIPVGHSDTDTTTQELESEGTATLNTHQPATTNTPALMLHKPEVAQSAPTDLEDKIDPTLAPEVVNDWDDEKVVVGSDGLLNSPTDTKFRMSATSGPLEDFPVGDYY